MRSIDLRLPVTAVIVLVVTACAGSPSRASTAPSPAATPTATAVAAAVPPSIAPIASASVAPKLDGQIVFDDFGDNFLHTQIWIEDADGSHVRKLVSDDFTDSAVSLSPDGKMVVFYRQYTDSLQAWIADPSLIGAIMVMKVDGSGLHEIDTGGRAKLCDAGPEGDAWSPDGRRIAYARFCFDKAGAFVEGGIWTINADGTDARRVTRTTPSSHTEDHSAGWSPDGKRLTFGRTDISVSPELSAIFTVAIDGTDLRQVTDWKVDANDPDWSPDGSLIAFNSPAEAGGDQNIYTIHPDGTGLTQLTKGLSTYPDGGQGTFHPSWSPDGTQILFSHNPSTGEFADFFVMKRDGSDLHVLALTTLEENQAHWGRSPGG